MLTIVASKTIQEASKRLPKSACNRPPVESGPEWWISFLSAPSCLLPPEPLLPLLSFSPGAVQNILRGPQDIPMWTICSFRRNVGSSEAAVGKVRVLSGRGARPVLRRRTI